MVSSPLSSLTAATSYSKVTVLHDRVPRHFGPEIKGAISIRQTVLTAGFNDSISIGSNNAFSIRTSLRLTIQFQTATMEERV